MDLELNNKLALVTGSTQGIGRAIAEAFDQGKAERGILLLHKPGGGDLEIRVARDGQKRDLPSPVLFSTSVAGKVAREKTPLRSMVNSDREALELGQSVLSAHLRQPWPNR